MADSQMQGMPPALASLATSLDALVLDEMNARKHDERNRDAVRRSLERYGWRQVVVARKSDNLVLAGNCRVACARDLGWTHAPVIFVEGTDAELRAYALADNRSGELATWDLDALALNIETIIGVEDVDMLMTTGFAADELHNLLPDLFPPSGDSSTAEFEPGTAEEQGRLDQIKPKQCPKCGHEF